MADEVLKIDKNFKGVAGGVTNDSDKDITIFRLNPITKRLLVEPSVLNYTLDSVTTIDGLQIPEYDYISLAYTATDSVGTVIYKTGGSGGTTVATLALAYDASDNLISVTKV